MGERACGAIVPPLYLSYCNAYKYSLRHPEASPAAGIGQAGAAAKSAGESSGPMAGVKEK
jgi:hypothetical protein